MIRATHRHDDGTQCYSIRERHALTKPGVFLLGDRQVVGAYMGYTGNWYFWDPETGEEVASIRGRIWTGKEMVDLGSMVEAMRISELDPAPECQR